MCGVVCLQCISVVLFLCVCDVPVYTSMFICVYYASASMCICVCVCVTCI